MATDTTPPSPATWSTTPELRFTSSGTAVASLRIAVTQRIQQDGQWRDGEIEADEVGGGRPNAAATFATSPPSEHPPAVRPRVILLGAYCISTP